MNTTSPVMARTLVVDHHGTPGGGDGAVVRPSRSSTALAAMSRLLQ